LLRKNTVTTPTAALRYNWIPEKKWETDAPLRKGMAGIRDDMASKLGEIHAGKLKKPGYAELSGKISTHTNSIFKNCKLSPKADAQLHLVLSQILGGNQQMKSAESIQDRRAGAIKIIDALQLYPKYFDHPGWQPLTH
jgi:hypothetical protein